ncbi:hypothetical protein GXP67_28620 [Rhodocytophaga rosea]|uniref:Uncharacterized protein n=1 Tax=Rhodocytophaga rosea TaxID=2704465 RepID=A0A6C0GQI8_9BACT|nr:hypothetical protein [Rhodocytophaga rosea]QHT70336.1 hypothetical protein GXP67_28620 [Rhodocytophaga rosea]
METMNNHNQICTYSIENLTVPQTDAEWSEGELEQKAQFLIARCYQILSDIKEKRDRMKLNS